MGRFPSGQREQTVNLPSQTSVVRIHPCPPYYSAGMAELADALDSGSSVRLGHAGSSPVSRTKALKTQRFQGFFLSFQGYFPSILRAKFCAGFLEENLVGRIGMKQVEGLGNVTVETAIEEFLKNCRFRSLTSTKQRTGICLVNAIRFSSTTLIDKKRLCVKCWGVKRRITELSYGSGRSSDSQRKPF